MSRYFWIMAKTSAGPFSASTVRSLLTRRARWTPSPESLGGRRELLLQVGPVGDDDDLEGPQHRVRAHRADQEDHREGLARALGVPDEAAAAVALAVVRRVLPVRSRCSARPTARYCW